MNIGKDTVALFHYTLSKVLEEGNELLESSADSEPMAYLHGYGGVMPALEKSLEGKVVGDKFTATLSPDDAYGVRKDLAPQRVPIKHLVGVTKKTKIKPGMVVRVNTEQGAKDATVVKAGKFNVDLDVNHPLAGFTLTFDIEILEVRDATAEELAHGHAHGVGGHHH